MGCGASKTIPKPDTTDAPSGPSGGGGGGGGGEIGVSKTDASGDVHVAAALRSKRGRKGVIHGERVMEEDGEFEKVVFPKTEKELEHIMKALETNILFASLSEADRGDIAGAMKPKKVAAGETVIKQGDQGDNFYVIKSGVFDIQVDNKTVTTFGDGTPHKSFGELALLYNSPRAATVKASTEGFLWAIDRIMFKRTVANSSHAQHTSMKKALRSVHLLEDLTDDQIAKVATAATVVKFTTGQQIITKGESGEVFYIISEGQVICKNLPGMQANNRLHAGDYFGERALLKSEPRACDVLAETDCSVMALHRDDFVGLLGHLRDVLDENQGMRLLLCVPIVASLSDDERQSLFSSVHAVEFKAGSAILQTGKPVNAFYIVKDGKVEVRDSGDVIKVYGPGEWFGEDELRDSKAAPYDYIAKSEVNCFMLERHVYMKLLAPLEADMKAAKKSVGTRSKPGSATVVPESKVEERKARERELEDIPFKELSLRATLGTGTFGRVKLAWHAKSKRAFALKMLQKAQIVALRQQQNIMNEKKILAAIDHPFILKLFATYKDANRLYMLLELVQGGELFNRLQNSRDQRVSVGDARFYGACVLDAFEYLHSMNIIYRDLKPENLLIDDAGYMKVVDFGFAKVVKDRTYTLCGTPEYLAPELVLGKGHNKGVDYWALGILMYEMVVGYSPFADLENSDQMVICKKILKGRVSYPREITSSLASLIKSLLERDIPKRAGCLKAGAAGIKAHEFFGPINFKKLYAKEIPAPWKPRIKDALDTRNFDEYSEEDDVQRYRSDGSNWDKDF